MSESYHVTLSLADCRDLIYEAVTDSVTGTLIGSHTVEGEAGRRCQVDVYEKHYYRAGNRLTLTVILDDFSQYTRVRCISGGGGEGLFRFDWGASERFEDVVHRTLSPYRIV